jgi:prevent-host-death family protein
MKIIKQKDIVGVKELRENLETYIKEVNKGNSFIVVRRSKPVFKISPIEDKSENWETVVDFSKIKKGGVSLNDVQEALTRLD